MMPVESSVSGNTIWSIALELLISNLKVPFTLKYVVIASKEMSVDGDST
jgi:hypothetical protein